MAMKLHYLSDKMEGLTLLVTGGAGFIGSNLVAELLRHPIKELRVFDDLSTGSERNLKELMQNPEFQFVEHDIRLPYQSEVDFILKKVNMINSKL